VICDKHGFVLQSALNAELESPKHPIQSASAQFSATTVQQHRLAVSCQQSSAGNDYWMTSPSSNYSSATELVLQYVQRALNH
jgi:hypothetical protein